MNRTTLIALACIAAAPALAGAAVIQGSGDGFVAFEGENFDTTDASHFEVITTDTDPDVPDAASLDAGLWVKGADRGTDNSGARTAGQFVTTYEVTFNQAGTYRVYMNGVYGTQTEELDIGEGADPFPGGDRQFANDSYFLLSNLDADASVAGNYTQQGANGPGALDYDRESSNGFSAYTVSAAQIGTPLTFAVSEREDGLVFDRWVFVLQGSGVDTSDSGLAALPNSPTTPIPEPASAGLAVAGLAGLLLRRRR